MNLSSKLSSHIENGKVGFPTTLASSVGVIMASPVILTVTSGFGIGGDTFALAVLLSFIMMQAQLTTFSEAAAILPTSGSVYDYISCGDGAILGYYWGFVCLPDCACFCWNRGNHPVGNYGISQF
ncbi:Uncharacterised protein [Providencia rustigianii]|nr:Uncharacterised protein [Providencia rustigianii]